MFGRDRLSVVEVSHPNFFFLSLQRFYTLICRCSNTLAHASSIVIGTEHYVRKVFAVVRDYVWM